MYSKLVEQYSIDMINLTRQYINGQLDEENYCNEINYLLEAFEINVEEELKNA